MLAIRLVLGFSGWLLLAFAVGMKLGPFMRHEDRLFGYEVPQYIQRS